VDDESLQGLAKGCPSLVSLDLHACQDVGDAGLQAVIKGCSKLETLVLSGTQVGITGLDSFTGGLPKLSVLRLNGDLITDDVLKSLARGCPNLAELYLANSSKISDEGVGPLIEACKSLKTFSAKASPHLQGTGFSTLAPALDNLQLPACGISDDGLVAISKNCPSVAHLAIPGCRDVSPTGLLSALPSFSNLRELIIVGCLQVSREQLLALTKKARPALKTVRVSRPDAPQDEYTIVRRCGGWNLPSWARLSWCCESKKTRMT
jgi:hypothetical protein